MLVQLELALSSGTAIVCFHFEPQMVGHPLVKLSHLLAGLYQPRLCNLQSPTLQVLQSGSLRDARGNHALRAATSEVLLEHCATISCGAADADHLRQIADNANDVTAVLNLIFGLLFRDFVRFDLVKRQGQVPLRSDVTPRFAVGGLLSAYNAA